MTFNRNNFITLNGSRLFTAKDVADLIRKNQDELATSELVAELCKREGVKEIVAYPYDSYRIVRYKHDNPSFVEECGDTGPARILVVSD